MPLSPYGDLVEDRAHLRALVDQVLGRLDAGGSISEIERQQVDLKEEAGRRGRGGVLLAGDPRNLAAADSLADEVACMANTPGGGALVVGVEDRTGSLLGAVLDAEWLRHRVWERVEVAPAVEERQVSGTRLLVLYIAEAREPVEDTRGQVRWRTGGACTPVDRSEWWLHRQDRSAHDPLAAASLRTLEDVTGGSLATVRRHIEAADSEAAAPSDRDLLVRIGAIRPDGHLTRAAALLLCPSAATLISVSVLDVEGGDVLVPPPDLGGRSVLEQLILVEERLDAVNNAVPVRSGFSEMPVRLLPPAALREAVCNALVHRDWLSPDPIEVTWIQADAALTVVSPGGFVGGVEPGNALTSRYARSPALADLFRTMRLVEKQGLGVDRMVRELVSLGHRPPRLREQAGPRVRVRLVGGQPVVPVLELMSRVQPAVRRRDVRVALVVHTLLTEPYVTPTLLEPVLQRSTEECLDAILAAADCRVGGEPLLVPYKTVWLLSPAALAVVEGAAARRQALQRKGLLLHRRAATAAHVVGRWLRDHPTLTSGDAAILSGLTQPGALRQLERLEAEGILVRGTGMGRTAHFVAGPGFRAAVPPQPLLSEGGPSMPSGTSEEAS